MSPTGRQTLPYDLIRGTFEGGAGTFYGTFALLVAIEYFHCSPTMKSTIAASMPLGLTLSVFYATYSHALIGRRTIEAALPLVVSGTCLLLAAVSGNAVVYTIFASLCCCMAAMKTPLLTGIYRENYKKRVRGQVFGLGVVVAATAGVLVSVSAGAFLDADIGRFRWLLLGLAALLWGAAWAILRMPSQPAARNEKRPNPFSYFRVLTQDGLFVYVLFVWFIFGIANLAMMPQRIEYVTDARYGFDLTPMRVAIIVSVIPEATRLLVVLPMARLFDQINFITLRIWLNAFFMAAHLCYFNASTVWMLVVGSILFGIATGGGSIAWSLWVTKFAPRDETTKYMAMHTFFTGVRGLIAPYIGYWAAAQESIPTTAGWAVALVGLSMVMLVPLLKAGAPNDRIPDQM